MSVAETMTFDGEALHLLDQRALPGEVRYLACRTADETAHAIRALVVRGAPAIGVAAAFGVAVAALRAVEARQPLDAALDAAHRVLAASRPTAVNLFWALDQMRRVRAALGPAPDREVVQGLVTEARKIMSDDVASCRAMGEFGAALFPASA